MSASEPSQVTPTQLLSVRSASIFESAVQQVCVLDDVSKELASTLDYEATLLSVAHLAVAALADWCAVDIVEDDGSIQRLAVAYADSAKEELAWEHARRYPPSPTALRGVAKVVRTGHSELIPEMTDAWFDSNPRDDAELLLLRQLDLTSGIMVPLVARDRTLGALSFATVTFGRRYRETDLVLAEEFAGRCALAIDNARLYRQAREAIQVRDAFLATVSHDLKSPLATISAQAQLLRRAAAREEALPSDRVSNGATRIEATVERMTRMIDELLDVARLELGSPLQLQPQWMDLVEVVRRIVAEHQQRADYHLIRVAAEPVLFGEWDLARLERVLDNLLGNAVKYSPDGGVITVVVVREEDDTGAWAILSVRDQGVGIPVADLGHIFERFHRARNVGRISGTGIGLAAIRGIVEQHGGTITVDSREGAGSTFSVRLPVCNEQGLKRITVTI